jgi:hypothetical protein
MTEIVISTKEELITFIREIIKNNIKRELYEIFGKKTGLNCYFPKIPCVFPDEHNKAQEIYKNLKGITVF